MSFAQRIKDESAFDSTYGKALNLAFDGGVIDYGVEKGISEDVVHLEGTVMGSGGSTYSSSVSLDLADEEIMTYSCTCPAYNSYEGICKHSAALALVYLDSVGIEQLHGKAFRSWTNPVRQHPVKRIAPSSPEVSRLIGAITSERIGQANAIQRQRRQAQWEAQEPVDVTVTLLPSNNDLYGYYSYPSSCFDTTWLLKLRLQRGKVSYVVKNMSQLVEAYRNGIEASYGKNLSFTHVPAAFTDRAREVLALVTRVVDSQQALFNSRYQYGSAGRGTDIKDLPLSCADVLDLLDIFENDVITIDPKDRNHTRFGTVADKPRQLEVRRGDPVIETTLTPTDDGGYDLVLPHLLDCFPTKGRLCVVDDGHAWLCSDGFARSASTLLANLLPAEKVHVSPNDLDGFCRTALPALRACTRLTAPAEIGSLVPPEPEFTFRVGLEDGVVFCDPIVAYGADELSIYDPERPGQPSRDIVAEYGAQAVVDAYFPNLDLPPWFDEADDERLYLLLTEGLRELAGIGQVLLSERLRAIEVRRSPQVQVKASVRSGLLDLEVNASGLAPRDLIAYLASYKRKQRFLRLSNGDIMRLDDSVRAIDDLADGLGIGAAELVGGATGLPSNRTLFVDALLRKSSGVRFSRDDAFRSIVRDFETFGDADIEIPACLHDVLRPYQEEGMRWLGTLERFGFGGILADDMGLGKTLQMIAHIVARKESGDNGTTLVVCPASLVYNWVAEFERFAPQLDVAAVIGSKGSRRKVIGASDDYDVLVTSYDLLKRDVEEYSLRHFARTVLDEAQYIKNADTQAAKAAKCLVSDVRFALTGTPIENRLSELWSIFDFLMPGILGTADAFTKRFADAVEAREEGAARRLQLMVSPFILRRLKADVLADLPEKNENVVFAQMEGEQAKLYKANQDRLALQVAHELPDEYKKNKLQVLAELTRLRQICCDPRLYYQDYDGGSAKLETCLELVRSAIEGGHGILLFSQFTSMLDIISKRLDAEKVGHLVLTGATSKEERARLVARFQAGEANVFLISLKAGGVGLNLTAADVVIHYDPWWNLAAQNQATDRAHRIGQDREVSVFKLIAKDTIEERIVAMQDSKRDLAESVLGGDEIRTAALDREGVLALLGSTSGVSGVSGVSGGQGN